MSRNLKHYQAFDEIVTNALLALYLTISQQGGYWTAKRRNEFLVKFIKPKIKHPQFSICKNELKTMLSIGRSATGNLEEKLWNANQMNLEYQAKFSQADELYIMLTELFEQHQFPSMLENLEKEMERDTLYMKEKSIEQGFDEDNNQIKPLPMKVKTHRLEALIEALQAKGFYRVEVDHEDEVIHLLLHRE
ncbi:DUF2913 family protein [Vibrio sp. L5-1]|jgi:hypothetical protein|uniref:DUF2913 family protein n=1 Tax=Vibrio qingdaonensis TaxID=2829491 RepID=A0A9X3CTK6_9VIBR|nr:MULTISPECIES: DUF2913 family protein [Vibrio]MCF7498012.1 DUF2913 family protein [Vibrio sp. L5-1]MCW8348225.1 DUF2913 family protein [Vibrio qingdaonensis]MDL5029480.1 DUF2913 family protein [Vibrio sp. TMPB1044]MDN5209608.1 DUF2913 family protein [Vibrio sp. TMPB1044]